MAVERIYRGLGWIGFFSETFSHLRINFISCNVILMIVVMAFGSTTASLTFDAFSRGSHILGVMWSLVSVFLWLLLLAGVITLFAQYIVFRRTSLLELKSDT